MIDDEAAALGFLGRLRFPFYCVLFRFRWLGVFLGVSCFRATKESEEEEIKWDVTQ